MRTVCKIKNRKLIWVISLFILLITVWLFPSFVPRYAGELYSESTFPVIALLGNALSACTHFSISENLLVCGVFVLIIGVVVAIVMLIVRIVQRRAKEYLFKIYRAVMIFAIVFVLLFQLMHGINFRRYPAKDLLGLENEEYDLDDYEAALTWAYNGMIAARSELGCDYNGVAHMQGSFEDSGRYANALIDSVLYQYDITASINYVRAKPVALSHYWSYLYITGAYDPVLGEANINTDYMDVKEFPITLCHEILHAKGFASETDCNLLATLACLSSRRADFRYAGYYNVFISLYSATDEYSKAEGENLFDYYSQEAMIPVERDMAAARMYWSSIDDEVDAFKSLLGVNLTEVSESTNNAYLEAYGQEGGTDTYVVPENYYVEFYYQYVENADA